MRIPSSVDFPALYLDGHRIVVIRKVLGRELEKNGFAYWVAQKTVALTDGKKTWTARLEAFRPKDPTTDLRALSARMSPPLPYSNLSHKHNGFNTRRTAPRGRHTKDSRRSGYGDLLDAFASGGARARRMFGSWRKKAARLVPPRRDPMEGRAMVYLPEK